MAAHEYIVAVRRDRRQDAPPDWLRRLGETEGITVIGSSGRRAQVRGDEEPIERLREAMGSYLHIEPVIPHRRL